MDDTTLKIAIAAFIHDIGKFADKESLGVTEQYINDNSSYLSVEKWSSQQSSCYLYSGFY